VNEEAREMQLCLGVDARPHPFLANDDDDDWQSQQPAEHRAGPEGEGPGNAGAQPMYEANAHVEFFTPSPWQLAQALDSFEHALRSAPLVPESVGAVSVCRSVRDGYLPRRFVQQVETRVLATLGSTLGRVQVLLDGRPTW
jgi:hypothetical protein